MTLKQIWIGVFISLFLVGCEDAAKSGAEAAIKAGQSAYDAAKEDAEKYLPAETKAVSEALAAAKAAFEKQDYAGALTAAKDMASKAVELGPAAVKAKEQFKKGWTDVSQTVPKMMTEVQTRASALRQAGKLPKDASDHLASAKTAWSQASEAFKEGNFGEAMSKANLAKNDLRDVAKSIGIKLAEASK